MNAKQYERANKNSYAVTSVIIISGIILAVFDIIQNGMDAGSNVIILSAIIGGIMTSIGFFRFKSVKLGSILIMGGATLFYFVLLIAINDIAYFAFGLPILLCSIVYLNVRLCKIGIVAILLSFSITVVKNRIANGYFDAEQLPAFITLSLAFIACLSTVTLLTKFNEENNEVISKNAQKSLETGNQMADIANTITDLFNSSQQNMQDLTDIISSQHNGMKDIATSMESTAQAITVQAQRVQEIQDQTNATEQHRKDMTKASENAQEAVAEGVKGIEELKAKSEDVSRTSQVTVDATMAVKDKVAEVTNIVTSILSISKQTNLLALNASIEAARAGEAGKGFAVVANDVRELAAETNTASNEITNIINELTEDVQKAMDSIDDTVTSVSAQNEMIEKVGENFTSINDNVSEMLDKFAEMGEGMKLIASSTTEINDSISNLSATSQEVASLSNEGERSSEDAVEKFEVFKGVLLNIFQESNKLRDMQTTE
ncbi:MAG: hypothetical protein K6G87_11125 [Butyrivibrio sp.]|uniref:methyl-accepting chemotaxis protein n=1 Tax=Butyrivibrio sp. TaxID=28121 RepID=UPI0025EFD4A0|nr:methyl-accepting chemotaxis protein [Butyrivibrio sp.]MCR5771764.1 hypothetical protein [Butyrivibrio sp.]